MDLTKWALISVYFLLWMQNYNSRSTLYKVNFKLLSLKCCGFKYGHFHSTAIVKMPLCFEPFKQLNLPWCCDTGILSTNQTLKAKASKCCTTEFKIKPFCIHPKNGITVTLPTTTCIISGSEIHIIYIH